MAALEQVKTGEDRPVKLGLTISSVPDISVLPQIIVDFFYKRNGIKENFSLHVIDPAEVDLVAEAGEEGRTINTITLNAQILEMVIPIADTDTLDLPDEEVVLVFAEITYFLVSGSKRKVGVDTQIINMEKSSVEGLA